MFLRQSFLIQDRFGSPCTVDNISRVCFTACYLIPSHVDARSGLMCNQPFNLQSSDQYQICFSLIFYTSSKYLNCIYLSDSTRQLLKKLCYQSYIHTYGKTVFILFTATVINLFHIYHDAYFYQINKMYFSKI